MARFLISVAAGLVLLAHTRATGAPDLDSQFKDQANAIAADALAIRRQWATVVGKLGSARGPKRPVSVARLQLSKPILGKDLVAEGVWDGRQWISFDVWIPAWKSAIITIDTKELALAAGAKAPAGKFTVRLPAELALDPDKNENIGIAISFKVVKGALKGSYSVVSGTAKKSGPVTCRLRRVDSKFAFPADYPAVKINGKNGFDLYALAVGLEREIAGRYRQILGFDSALKGISGRDFPAYQAVRRPEFSASKKKKGGGKKKGATKKAAISLDDMDDLGDDLDLGDDDVGEGQSSKPTAAVKVTGHPDAKDRLQTLQEIRTHVTLIKGATGDYLKGGGNGKVADSFAKFDDPQFGPWFGFKPLPKGKGKPNILPAHVTGGGKQEWLYVDNWRVIGPYPLGAPATQATTLPHQFPLPQAVYSPYKEFIPRPKVDPKAKEPPPPPPTEMKWQPGPADISTGMVRPPQWYYNSYSWYGACPCGTKNTSWFAATDVHSSSDCEMWVAAGADDDAMIWINNRLVAAWPAPNERCDLESPIMFRTKFRKGRNAVLVRMRQAFMSQPKEQSISGFWVRICTKGEPLAAAAVRARDDAVSVRMKTIRPFGPEVRGWRGNWQGVEPDVKPVTAWDWKKRINIKWCVSLPMTISTPIVTGNKIMTLADPCHIFCFDKMTGKQLWMGDYNVMELLDKPLYDQSKPKYLAYLDALKAAYTKYADHEETYDKMKETLGHDEAAKQSLAIRKKVRDAYGAYWKPVSEATKKAGHITSYLWSGYMGLSCATPVTDGKHVWVWTAMGAAACFDLDGNRKWLVEIPNKGSAYGAFSSPLLVDGKLIMETVPKNTRPGGGSAGCEFRDVWFLALDAVTGKERWRCPVLEPIGSASPVAMRITNGKEDMAVIITAGSGCSPIDGKKYRGTMLGGTVVRADDGKVLIKNMSVNTGYGTPVVDGDIIYHCGLNMMSATKLIMADRDTVGAQRLWTQPHIKGFEPCVSPYKGHLYVNLAIGCVGGQGNGGYTVISSATGETVPRHVNVGWPLYTGRDSRSYVPTYVAGGYVFCGDSGEGFGGKERPNANMTVIEAKPQGRIIAQNGLPPRTNSGLMFDGDRMYYRNVFNLICVGYTGDEGKIYEAEENARLLMEDLPKERPPIVDTVTIAPEKGLHHELPRRSLWGRPGPPYYLIGSFSSDMRDRLLQGLTGQKRAPVHTGHGGAKGIRFAIDGLEEKVGFEHDHPHSWSHMSRRGRARVFNPSGSFWARRWTLKANDTVYVYTIMKCDRDRVVRFIRNTSNRGVTMWLGGTELKHQGRYRLSQGDYTFLAELKAAGSDHVDDLCVDCWFVEAKPDAKGDVKAYLADLHAAKPYLDRLLKLKPDSKHAPKAKQFLAALK